jgi:hypothetical protein
MIAPLQLRFDFIVAQTISGEAMCASAAGDAHGYRAQVFKIKDCGTGDVGITTCQRSSCIEATAGRAGLPGTSSGTALVGASEKTVSCA